VKIYLDYITTQLLPELKKLIFKFSTWWTFKPNSSLKSYLTSNNIFLDEFFLPNQLLSVILHLVHKKNMQEVYNENIIVLSDIRLQHCFQSSILYKPNILGYCLPHIDLIANEQTATLMKRMIHNELYVDIPEELIYRDPSSLFWLHPDVNRIITDNKKIVFSWKELNLLFLDFITTNNTHFLRKEDMIFYINENSILSEIFNFKFFHKNQIEDILKQLTRFLGKSNNIKNCCEKLSFKNLKIDEKSFSFIDKNINNYNKLLPSIISPIDLS
jgi:hypothetical protein